MTSIFDELRAAADQPFESAHMLPVAAYCDERVLRRELDVLFGVDWLCVGRTADVPDAGSFATANIPWTDGGLRSVVLVRGDDGEVRVFDNVCVHRGARLIDDGRGTTARITCRYHAWAYRLDGSIIGAPHMPDAVDLAQCALGALATEVWEGFVFVSQRGDPEPLAPQLSGLSAVVGRYEMASYVGVHDAGEEWGTNWKLLVENFMDAYHVFKVHAVSFGATGDSTSRTEVLPGTDRWTHHRVLETDGSVVIPEHDGRLERDWRHTVVLAAVFPNFVVQLQPDWLWFLRLTPLGTDRVRIEWQVAVAPSVLDAFRDTDAKDRYVAELLALIDQVNSEDRPIVEGVRAGVHRPQFVRGPMAALERNVYDFDRYVAGRLTTDLEDGG